MKRLLNLALGFFVFLALFLSPDPLTEDYYIIYAEAGECEFVEVPGRISSEKPVPITVKNKTDNKKLTYVLIYHEPVGESIPGFNSQVNIKRLGPQTVEPGAIITFFAGPLKPGPHVFYAARPGADAPDCQSTPVGIAPQTRVEPTNQPRPASKPLLCDSDNGIQTAIGCIPIRDTNAFVGWFLRWAVGLGGGVAFLLIVISAFQIMTSGNNPQQLQGGRELLTAAISGLILIIFSVFLLRLIGVQILNIPGFG